MKMIFRGDDLGISEGVNYGLLKSIQDGALSCVGIMPNMESYAKRLKASIRNNDNEACQDACLDILKWGGVIRENQERIKAQTNLVNYLMKAEVAVMCT